MPSFVARLVLGLLLVSASTACITHAVRRTVFDEDRTKVRVRGVKSRGQLLERGFDHPVTIAETRLLNILSRIDVRTASGKSAARHPALPTESLDVVSKGLARGLAAAGADEEVVVLSVFNTQRFGIFDHDYLTSFVAYVEENQLYLHFSRIDWEIPAKRRERLPEPALGDAVMSFRMLGGNSIFKVGAQSVRVSWRDPIFRTASNVRRGPSGKLKRRTILAEDPWAAVPPVDPAHPPADLSPESLRALADLEEARRRGDISEAEYRARRADLFGKDEAP